MVVSGPDAETSTKLAAELQFLERRGEAPARSELERALDLVRRYLSRVLAELPLGVCAVDREGEIVVWNRALVELTRIEGGRVLGARPRDLSAPWAELLTTALAEGGQRERRIRRTGAGPQILRLTCTRLDEGDVEAMGAVLLVEDLSERRALLAELSHRDRLASVGRLAAGVAHEVLNPLTGILMVARNLARELEQLEDGAELDPELELPERLGTVVSEAQRIEVIVRGLLTFSRGRKYDSAAELERDRVELEPLVDEAVRIARLARRERSVEVGVECPTGLEIEVDGQQLIQVLVNLLTNAIDASPEGERVELRCTPTQDGAQLEVLDRGGGIEAELAERVFEPFFTTKTAGEGTGLGLAVSHRIIAAHGGTLSWSPRDGGGARFVVHLPDMLRGEREVSA
nr:ATP-binding protein [Pseudenhygromyxa sp. WMMC2535]